MPRVPAVSDGLRLVAVLVAAYCGVALGHNLGVEEVREGAVRAQAVCERLHVEAVVTRRTLARIVESQVTAQAQATREDVRAGAQACAVMAETCAVPGWWLDMGVVPLPRVAAVEVVK